MDSCRVGATGEHRRVTDLTKEPDWCHRERAVRTPVFEARTIDEQKARVGRQSAPNEVKQVERLF